MKGKVFLIYAVLWLMMIGLTFYQQVDDVKKYAQSIAVKKAEMFFQQIVLMRQWNAEHGGVYVPVTENTKPDPYLSDPNRDVLTSNGILLTLINPAYMTRELSNIEFNKSGISFHITSLRPIRAENKADDWETKALQSFESGASSVSALDTIQGKSFYRYMAPVRLESSCLKCHVEQGFKVGDIRGGISVSIPEASNDAFVAERIKNLAVTHTLIATAGFIALLLSYLAQSKLTKRLDKAKSHLQLAYLDSLTLLPNRRYYDAFVRREWRRALRHHYPISMIMIDIDCFKAYNDNLGHVEGDHCLRQVARTLKRYFRRPGDLIARYGGEEFCVVAACDAVQIMQLAEILRLAVETMQVPHPDSKVSKYVTISLGIATLIPNEKTNCEQLLLNADHALYTAKQSGRNRVEQYFD